MDFYEAYGFLAEKIDSPTLLAGRNAFQSNAEKYIYKDVITKLRLKKTDRILEIGCGVGIILNPISKYVKQAVGLDHQSLVNKYKANGVPSNVKLLAGRWPETKVSGTFDRILVYSVLHYLPNAKSAKLFIVKCLEVLRPGGTLMLGDIPNSDSSRRFIDSSIGKRVNAIYQKEKNKIIENIDHKKQDKIFSSAEKLSPYLNDKFVISLISDMRVKGYGCYIMPQPKELPFSYSREDIVIYKY